MGVLDYMTPQTPQNNTLDSISRLRKMFSPSLSSTPSATPSGILDLGESQQVSGLPAVAEQPNILPQTPVSAQIESPPQEKFGLSKIMPLVNKAYDMKTGEIVDSNEKEEAVVLDKGQAKDLSSAFLGGEHKISQNYGANPAFYRKFGFKGHEGTDISVDAGTPIIAPFDGKVEMVGTPKTTPKSKAYGNWLRIKDSSGENTFELAHLSKFAVAPGTSFKAGQIIGYTGNTGRSTGAHLHINAYKKGQRYNPVLYTGGSVGVGQSTPQRTMNQPSSSPRVSQYSAPRNYLVKKGNTLSEIAQQNRTTVQAILNKNKQIKNPNLIYAGSTINLA